MRRCPRGSEGILFYEVHPRRRAKSRALLLVMLDDLVPGDHVCRVIDAFVDGLAMGALGFERAQAAEMGPPGYDPRDLLKLYLYGYLHQLRSSRRLEAECRRNGD